MSAEGRARIRSVSRSRCSRVGCIQPRGHLPITETLQGTCLEARLREEPLGIRGRQALADTLAAVPEDDDDLTVEEQENLEETLVDRATAARDSGELRQEIATLRRLEQQARVVVNSEQDRKWDELSRILHNEPAMRDTGGRQRKPIIISEHRDTSTTSTGGSPGFVAIPTPSSRSPARPTATSAASSRNYSTPIPTPAS